MDQDLPYEDQYDVGTFDNPTVMAANGLDVLDGIKPPTYPYAEYVYKEYRDARR